MTIATGSGRGTSPRAAEPLADALLAAARTPAYLADPYPWFRAMRDAAPLHVSSSGLWFVPRHADVAAALRRPELSADVRSTAGFYTGYAPDDAMPSPVGALDPPHHGPVRLAMNQVFRGIAERVRPRVEVVVEELLAAATAGGGVIDVAQDLANPLPVVVISELFGILPEHRSAVARWSSRLATTADPNVLLGDAERAAAAEAANGLTRLVGRLAGRARRRSRDDPQGDDLLSALAVASAKGRQLSFAELLVNAVFLLVVGHYNSSSLVNNGVLALARHPAEEARLRAQPELLPNAVDELLRFDSPVQTIQRVASATCEIAGTEVPAGAHVVLLVGSANRDPAVFPRPDVLDVARPEARRNLGFGLGAHLCVGASLARLEAEVAIAALLRRCGRIELAGEPERLPTMTLRGLRHLPVRLDRA